MPDSQPPLVFFDNVYDRINQYPQAVLSSTAFVVGRDPKYVADYRRERSLWQAATALVNHAISVDLGVGITRAVSAIFIDRGHNLWGQTLAVIGSDDNFGTTPTNLALGAVPALVGGQFVPGGDPSAGWAVTEEGALYQIFALTAARRYWQVKFTSVPVEAVVITGIILGAHTQLASYSKTLDEDSGGRKRSTEESEAGYVAASRVYTYRTLSLDLALIGAAEYDNQIRTLRRALFERQIPAFVCMNYGRWPERSWLYTLDSDRWSFPTNRVYRAGTIPLRELYPLIR
jgi:hypothetical protein